MAYDQPFGYASPAGVHRQPCSGDAISGNPPLPYVRGREEEVRKRCLGCNCFLRSGQVGKYCSSCNYKRLLLFFETIPKKYKLKPGKRDKDPRNARMGIYAED